jgi:hypothetical protein
LTSTNYRLALALTAVLFGGLPKAAHAQADIPFEVRLTKSAGPVNVTTGDGKARGKPPVYNPFIFEEGDYITTGSSATVDLSFSGGTLIRLGPKSALKLARLSDADSQLFLKAGVLLAKVQYEKNKGQQFKVITPSAVATVKGTEFVIEENGSYARIGVLDEGHVSVTARGFKKDVLMHFNQETQVPRGLSPRDAHVLEHLYHYKPAMADMRQRIKIIRKHWTVLTPEQRRHIRAAWEKRHAVSLPRRRLKR